MEVNRFHGYLSHRPLRGHFLFNSWQCVRIEALDSSTSKFCRFWYRSMQQQITCKIMPVLASKRLTTQTSVTLLFYFVEIGIDTFWCSLSPTRFFSYGEAAIDEIVSQCTPLTLIFSYGEIGIEAPNSRRSPKRIFSCVELFIGLRYSARIQHFTGTQTGIQIGIVQLLIDPCSKLCRNWHLTVWNHSALLIVRASRNLELGAYMSSKHVFAYQ